jgi:ATP-dependent NAD(P)H-hydrate dehydratase
MQAYAKIAVSMAKERGMYIVLDADGLYMIGEDISVIKGYRRAVLTPNVVEFKRLSEQVGIDPKIPNDQRAALISKSLGGVTLLQKGAKDIISSDTTGDAADLRESRIEGTDVGYEKIQETVEVDIEGGLKRCGGQGDVLSGCVGTFMAWGRCYEDGTFG